MKAVFIDSYRHNDQIVIWLKTPDENIRIVKPFTTSIYLECNELSLSILKKFNIPYTQTKKTTYIGEKKEVFEIKVIQISKYESFVRSIEREARHRLTLYNADIAPEQMYLYRNNLKPFSLVDISEDTITPLSDEAAINLEKSRISVMASSDIRANCNSPVRYIRIDDDKIEGSEDSVLKRFAKIFTSKDPDVILMDNAFSVLPYLVKRMQVNGINCNFNRWDDKPIKSRGGKTFFSYGKTLYREYAIRLNGRFLIDSNTTVGEECSIDGIMELSYLSGTRFQQVASRSFGAVFQFALIAEMIKRDYIVPFKEKPVDPPLSLYHHLKFDRVGHTFDPIIGLHHDVAEIDFSSLFPWIIYNYNISTETILHGGPPYQNIPGLPLKISLEKKGIIPTAIKPLIDRRMHYKKNPSSINRDKIQGLKWVLVTSYGYLRFREFKLGMATNHMAIGSFAREIMMKAKELCEERGFRIVHGIIDSLYIQKKGISENEVRELCREIELETGVPICFEGIFKWVVFMPSVSDDKRPVPTRYYGVYKNGEIKVRGIEMRQSGVPKIIKLFQQQVVEMISKADSKEDIQKLFPYLCQQLRKTLFILPTLDANILASFIRVSKTEYEKNIPQKEAINLIKKKGITIFAGQRVYYIYGKKGIVLPEDYNGKPNLEQYKKLLVRSLFVILQPFGFTKDEIYNLVGFERQSNLAEFEKQEIVSIEE